MVRKTGLDPAASCTPSTRSAWLSYVLIEMVRSTGIEPASLPWHGKILPHYYERESGFEMVDGAGIEPAVRKRSGFTVRRHAM